MRSRTDMAMVLPDTSSRVKMITPPMVATRPRRLPSMEMKLMLKAFSVSLLVGASVFWKAASTAAQTFGTSSSEAQRIQ